MSARRAALVLAFALTACAALPTYPLLSPIAAAQNFGYAETKRGDDRYSVTYTTPTRASFAPAGPDADDADAARRLGYDMAVWRAAELASAGGFAGFHVSHRQADVSYYPDPADLDFPRDYWGPAWWRLRQPFWQEGRPWLPPRLLIAARVTIAVELLHAPGAGDYETAGELARLEKTYPGAAGAPPER